MTEDEEWEFIKKKYIPEPVDDASNPEDKELIHSHSLYFVYDAFYCCVPIER